MPTDAFTNRRCTGNVRRGSFLPISPVEASARRFASLETFKSQWRAHRLSTAPADRAAAEEGVRLAYRDAGLAAPCIIWCDGPIGLARSWASARARDSAGANCREAVIDGPQRRVRELVDVLLDDGVASLRDMLADDVSCAVSGAAHAAAMEEAHAVRPSIMARIHGLRAWLAGARNGQGRPAFADSGWSQHQLCGLSFYAYLHDVLGMQATGPLRGLWLVAGNAGWMVPHERVCWLADRPDVLSSDRWGRLHCADGPALRYRDGWARHAWHGVPVPAWVIEHPEQITLPWIDAEIDPLVRHAMIDIFTPERFISEGGADRVSSDEAGILWSREWTYRGAVIDAWAAVELSGTIPRREGVAKASFRCVSPDVHSAREAVARIFGPTAEEKVARPQSRPWPDTTAHDLQGSMRSAPGP